MPGERVIVQGLGNVGYHAAKFLREEDDVRIVAIIERDGALLDDNGLDPDDVLQYIRQHRTIKDYPKATFVEEGRLCLESECDILIPAALENQITESNAARIQARLVVEGANGPTTYGADEILRSRGIVILPDFYVNAGGVTVSYFEWIKNLSHIRFGRMQRRLDEYRGEAVVQALEQMLGKPVPEALKRDITKGADELTMVRSGLDDTMREAYQEIRDTMDKFQIEDFRTAAMVVSVSKIVETRTRLGV